MNAPESLRLGEGGQGAGLNVRRLEPHDHQAWAAFAARCPEATFFHRIEWKAILEEVFGYRTHYLVAERGGALAGILPLAEVKSLLFGHALTSLPFCVYGGSAAVDAAAASALHAAARELGATLRVNHLELRSTTGREPDWPRQDLYVTFRKALLPEVDANMLAIPRKQRAMVRKGIKNGLRAELDGSADRFFELYADNVHRHGTPGLPKRYFERLLRDFGSDCRVLTVTDSAGGTPVSSVLSFYFRDEVLPYYAGDDLRARELAANDFKYWELMRDAVERGLRVFDFGRSKRGTGSFDFKHNWGFEPTPLHYEFALYRGNAIPQNNPLNPKYKMMIALWRRMPRALVDRAGPYIVRGLG